MILVTGTAGKTGQAVVTALVEHGVEVRGLIHRKEQSTQLHSLGVTEICVGDMNDETVLQKACHGVNQIYHICPNMSSDELTIGKKIIRAAQDQGAEKLVYHSVLHPQVEEMPHHWLKLQVEAELFKSGLDYVVLQPAAYMQNVLGYWDQMMATGLYQIPYAVTSRQSMVDLTDIAEIAALVLTSSVYNQGVFELCADELLSASEVAEIISKQVGFVISAAEIDRTVWKRNALQNGMNQAVIETLTKMFEYYDHYGLAGNSYGLNSMLGRPVTNFSTFITRHLKQYHTKKGSSDG